MSDHYRVGPGRCKCGFSAEVSGGILADWGEVLRAHLQAAQRKRSDRITDLEADNARLRAKCNRLARFANEAQHYLRADTTTSDTLRSYISLQPGDMTHEPDATED